MAFLWRKKVTGEDGQTTLVGKYQIAYRIRVNGKWQTKMQTTGTDNLDKANRALGKFETHHAKGVNDVLFKDFMRDMAKYQTKHTANFERKEKYTFDRLVSAFGDYYMSAISAGKVTDWQEGLLNGTDNEGKALAPGSVNKYMRSLRHIFNVAIKKKAFTGPSPFERGEVEICEPGRPRELILEPNEQARLLDACQ